MAIGSGIGGLPGIEKGHEAYMKGGPRKISPFFVPSNIINMISGNLSIMYGMKGPNIALVTACATATHSIGDAARIIEYGDADVMIAGGAEMATSPCGLGGFSAARALSTRNDDPKAASRPWDKDRDGFVLGEGAGIVVDVGPGVTSVKKGDHVIPLYTPECRQCKSCLSQKTNLCTAIRATQGKGVMPDGTSRFSYKANTIYHYMGCSTFSNFTVLPEIALAKIREDAPFDKVCYIGCGVTTGIGAVINTAKVEPGATVVVIGCGGIGLSCINGAAISGAGRIIAVDTVPSKLDLALKFGASIVPTRCQRLGGVRFRITFHEPLRPADVLPGAPSAPRRSSAPPGLAAPPGNPAAAATPPGSAPWLRASSPAAGVTPPG